MCLEYMQGWNKRFYEEPDNFYPSGIGTIEEAFHAEIRIQELRSQVWTPERLPSFTIRGLDIHNGLKLPAEVAQAENREWSLAITVREEKDSARETTRIVERLNKDLLAKARGKTAEQWQELRATIQGDSKASRDSQALRALRSTNVQRSIQEAFAMSTEDAEDLFGMAVPGFSFFISLGRTFMYAKEGNVAGSVVEGAFVLLDILGAGIVGPLAEKAGKLVRNPAGKTATKVVEVNQELVKDAGQTVAEALRVGAGRLRALATRFRDAGMNPQHAKAIHQFAVDKEFLIVVRSANSKSLDYHNLTNGFKPKPMSLKFGKTDEATGLVKGSVRGGRFVDARDTLTSYSVREVQGKKIIFDASDRDTGFRLTTDGFVVDANDNRFFSDYDLMGVYENSTTKPGVYQPKSIVVGRSGNAFLDELNRAVDSTLDMFQHGGNDEYWKVINGDVKPGHTGIGNEFKVFHPDGRLQLVDLQGLKQIYLERGIAWPY
jgi:hypothetical protein